MKPKSFFLLLTLFAFSCANENRLTFEPVSISNEKCNSCPIVHINIPKAVDQSKISETINGSLKEEIISLLSFSEAFHINNINAAMESFKTDYHKLKEKFPEESTPWEAKINGAVTFENDVLITIQLDSYVFTGGAHGYNPTRFLNFDKVKGEALKNEMLFKSEADFIDFAEKKFRLQEHIKLNANINSTGYMFEGDVFYVPQNIGYTAKGIQLTYVPYEISSYADGAITLTIPFEEANRFLKYPNLP